jgi:hypothetical protein
MWRRGLILVLLAARSGVSAGQPTPSPTPATITVVAKAPPVIRGNPEPVTLPAGKGTTVRDLANQLAGLADRTATADAVQRELELLAKREGLVVDQRLTRDFARVRLVFEMTRAGGPWGLHWAITDRQPTSRVIWAQWSRLDESADLAKQPTAHAECDELSALTAFLARSLGVGGIGLFYPTLNHTVAVWKVGATGGNSRRVVLPTSQVFLSPTETLGTLAFATYPQRPVYDYTNQDVPESFVIPRWVAEWFVSQANRYGSAPAATLQELRNLREGLFNGERALAEVCALARLERSAIDPAREPDRASALDAFATDYCPVDHQRKP